LLGLADRVLVLRDGAVAGELPGGASEEDVMRLASGGGRAAETGTDSSEEKGSGDA
jgi:ABC-type sugar transport system ATPase subunit